MVFIVVLALTIYWFGWDWTGFNGGVGEITTTITSQGTTTTTRKLSGKTLWDLLQILIIPVVLVVGGFWLKQIQKNREEIASKQRADDEQKIAADNQREVALQAYIDNISDLLLEKQLRTSLPQAEVRKIARVRTMTVLPRLGSVRQRAVLQFLHESDLIKKDKPIIALNGAYLRGVDLHGVGLYEDDLHGVDLRDANLKGADLSGAKLNGAILNRADMSGAKLKGADLNGADLIPIRSDHATFSV
jgi:uncharacterized protein YjbI with pentapeptide repeats